MENEIKVGDWIRTNRGTIDKITSISHKRVVRGNASYLKEDIVKHSPNLIDLIQCGDYVNGYLVRYIIDINTGEEVLCNFDLNEMRWIPLQEIDVWYEVVTKEMMESISYKVTKM